MNYGDDELLYYCHMGSEEGFNELHIKHRKTILITINSFMRLYSIPGYEMNDLYNEALITLYECVHSYCSHYDIKFVTYFSASLRFRLIQLLRQMLSNKKRTNVLALSLDTPLPDGEESFYTIINSGDLCVKEQLNNLLTLEDVIDNFNNNLGDLEKEIAYYHITGHSYSEIAQIKQVETKKVDNTIQKYRRLIQHIKEQ